MMHIAKNTAGYYWCLDDKQGASTNGNDIEAAFMLYHNERFDLNRGSQGYYKYAIIGNAIFKLNEDEPYATILCSFPDGTTYTQFTKLFPELVV